MSSFGGTVKLTGESEYRKALTRITQNLRETSSALTLVDSQYSKNDNSIATVTAKNEKLNSILEKQKTAYNNLKSSFDTIKGKYDEQINSHNKLQAEYDDEKAKLEKLKNTVGESSTAYEKQKAKVGELATQLNKSQQNIDANEVAMSKLRVQMNNAETSINKTSKEIDNLGKETKETTDDINKAGDGFTVFKGILADLGSKAIQSAISGIKKLGSAVIDVGKQAISSYAEYEQLVGGVETLFKESAGIVQKYANDAYKTAGLSANEYMETVTSFSASLLQSLGNDTTKASEYANRAIIDMSDNANKMGTAMESIQYAYQGFAKQNYTMLDNLKLGYGGTKEEMARLISDASKMTDIQKELNLTVDEGNMSFGNIVNAISVVQKNMGIMGTTSKEASTTIQGSINSMKSAWQNLLTGLADDTQDFNTLVDNFVDSVITSSKNLVPRIKKTVEGIKSLVNNLVKDVFPKLKREIPQLKPLIETFEWFIKNKNLVVNSIKLMVTAFAVAKITQFTKALSDGVKGLIAIATATSASTVATNANTASQVANTTAQIAGTTATTGLTVATNLLNAAWKANPIGLVITGVTALISVFSLLKSKSNEVSEAEKLRTEEIQKQSDKIKENKDAWEQLKEAQQNSIDTGMTEISNYQSLYSELQNIVDANGKVKDGYEKRASFITSTLSDALGIEISMVDGVIQNYDALSETIDAVMEKKKAQIILDSQESLYAEAIKKQQEALQNLNNAEEQLSYNRELRATYQEQREEAERNNEFLRMQRIDKSIKKLDEETAGIQKNYDEQKALLSEYAYNIGVYENNMALAHAGEYEKMTTVTWDYVKNFQDAGDAEKAMLEDRIKTTETQLNVLKELKEKNNTDIYDAQIKASEKQLTALKEDMKKYTSAVKEGNNNAEKEWLDGVAKQLTASTSKRVEFKQAGNDMVQMYIDGVKTGEPKAYSEMQNLAQQSVDKINEKKTNATWAGENLIDGVNIGISNQNKQSSVFSSIYRFGNNILSNLQASLQEHSPSKATEKMGVNLLKGLGIGIDDEENNVLKQAKDFGKDVISSMQTGLSKNSFSGLSSQLGNVIPTSIKVNGSSENNSDTYIKTVEAFKDALGQMKIELDDENMGKFIDKTVARTIYS